ncbi:MAG: ABC transporter permease [Desulfobacteraceae bacterium]|nr:ABC transporter permease [Desulfobacteraceae bacterium]
MGLLAYIARRLIFLVFILLGVSLMVFVISHLVPGDPVLSLLSARNLNNPEIIQAYRAKWGLDKPLHEQYLLYMENLVHGDMGRSIRTNRPVLDDLLEFFPATIELALLSIFIAVSAGLLFGIISAIKRNSATDQLLRSISVLGVSTPSFWAALVFLYVFYYQLGWAEGPGRLSTFIDPPLAVTRLFVVDALLMGRWDIARNAMGHLILPAVILGAFTMGLITRTTRSSLLEVMSRAYVQTARAKGLSEKLVILRHALGNALIPVITVIGLGFGNLLGGTVLVETIFAWPGIGSYAYNSATSLDFPAIIGVSLLIAFNYVCINLFIDILYGFIDPRVRYE